jgi:putative PIN family toxin of toxin-antitoxin system
MKFRAVLDTNVVLAAQQSGNLSSPNVEILARWQRREFVFLFSFDTLTEYSEKLLARGFSEEEAERLITLIALHGEAVSVEFFHFRHYPVDPDDVMFLLCSLNGAASHLVSYDSDLLSLHPFYADELTICEPLGFLQDLRKHIERE